MLEHPYDFDDGFLVQHIHQVGGSSPSFQADMYCVHPFLLAEKGSEIRCWNSIRSTL